MANKTRKSLAVASSISLGIGTALVGFAPAANAVDPVSLTPLAGTSYTVSALDDFQLKALFTNAAVSGGPEVLKFHIVDADAGLTVNADDGSGYDEDGDDQADATANANDVLVPALDADDKDAVVATALTDGDEGTAAEFILVPAADATFSVTVQAWMDFDADGEIDADEYKSPVRTVNFIKSADLDWTLTSVQPALGDANLEATLVSGDGINLSQTSAEVEIAIATYVAGDANKYTPLGDAEEDGDGVFDVGNNTDADGDVSLAAAGGNGVTAATYVFVGLYNGAEVTAEQFRVVAAGVADAVAAPSLVASSDVKGVTIREGANSVVVESAVTDGGESVGAGYAATVTLTDVDLKADTSITAGGKTLTAGGDAVSFDTVTNADGKVSFTVSGLSAQDAGDSFNVAIKVDALAAVNDDFDVTAEDTASFVSHNLLGTDAVLKVTEGSSYTLRFAAVDNFDQPETRNMRVKLNDGGAVTKFASVNNGVATFSVTDDADVDEAWTATLQIWNAADGAYEDEGIADATITPVVGNSNAATAISSIDDEDVDLNLADLDPANTRLGETAPTVNNESSDITGVVTDSTGAATYAQVTISAPGVLFAVTTEAGADTLFVLNSVTVSTNAAGTYGGVTAISNTSGDVTVTVSSGSASEEVVLTFAAPAVTAGETLSVAVANAEPGKTMTVTATLTDEYGNAVDTSTGVNDGIQITYDGPGFVVGDLPTDTNADGKAVFRVLLGSNDTLSGDVTVKYNHDDDASFADDGTITETLDLTPVAPVADTKVNAGSFKGYVAIYAKGHEGKRLSAKVGNDWVVVPALASNFVRVVEYTGAGYTIAVRIYIDRVLVDTITVTTK